ncbi:hypothetical protein [Deinococcus fonticola]|uniref:hypothetical protein n=1 Tax=Deinococcus fonticola TaxID=2528713 RepID=UPI0010755127|nr:hypothetical protein [Deinococcus fonticola]
MLTEPARPTRTEQAEITARTCRTERQRRAALLRELRREAQQDPSGREYLEQCRAEFARNPAPNPDRARQCRRECQRALDRHSALVAEYDTSLASELLLDFAAEDADVWVILLLKARQ